GDVPTLVLDGQTGILVPSENVERLAEGIAKLLQDSDLRSRFGEAAKKLIEKEFSAKRMAWEYLRVYNDTNRLEDDDGTGFPDSFSTSTGENEGTVIEK
ncbi:MAG: glycosyltransferase, partial [Nitrososphaerales archaeon]